MNFATLRGLTIPEGKVTNITRKSDGKVLWNALPKFRYVSLGDSIAAGHRIDKNWDYKYSWGRQYRRDEDLPAFPTVEEANAFMEKWIKDNQEDIDADFITYTTVPQPKYEENPITGKHEFAGYCYHYRWHTSTKIVENSYTDLIRKKLQSIYGENNVTATSFAVSGSLVYEQSDDPSPRSLYDILDDPMVMEYLPNANLVTVSIGANVVLGPALKIIPSFLMNGVDLSATEATIENSLRQLADPNYQYSYIKLFAKLAEKNPNAKYVFSTVYNPVKYMYLDRGTWDKDFKDGFFGKWLNNLPQITIGGWEADREIKKLILDTELLVNIRNRVNGYGDWEGFSEWAKRYLETGGISADGTPYLGLRQVIINAIDEIKKNPTKYSADINPDNFVYTDTYELFNTVPDRQGAGEVHFNDLVNMQLTRGYDANDLPWDNLWGNEDGDTTDEKQYNYWSKAIAKHTSSSGIDFNGIIIDLAPDLINKIISVAFDPHPRTDGHYLYYRSIIDSLDWEKLNTVTFNANGDSGEMAVQKVLDKSWGKKIYSILQPNKFTPQTGYYHTGWKDGSGNSYSDKQAVYIPNNITLNAQWNNEYVVKYYKFTNVIVDDYSKHTGHMELRSLTIGNTTRTDLNTAFALKPTKDNPCYVTVRYGDKITIHTHCKPAGWDGGLWFKEHNCNLTYPGGSKTGTDITWTFDWNLINPQKNRNIIIDYQWFYQANTDLIQRWFSWWDCHVKIE